MIAKKMATHTKITLLSYAISMYMIFNTINHHATDVIMIFNTGRITRLQRNGKIIKFGDH